MAAFDDVVTYRVEHRGHPGVVLPSLLAAAYHPRQMNDLVTPQPASLARAAAREQAGDPGGADAIYAQLYNQARPDPAVLLAWSRLRRRAGDAKNADTMLNLAAQAGGGAPVLIEMAAVLIDQGLIDQRPGRARGRAAAPSRPVRPLAGAGL